MIANAKRAKAGGAQRFCMGAAWRQLKDRDVPALTAMISGVKALGLETYATLGMLTRHQAKALKAAGLDFYKSQHRHCAGRLRARSLHARLFQERLDTLAFVREAGLSVCCGGIVGMGETRTDRAGLLHTLATMPAHPRIAARSTRWCRYRARHSADRRHSTGWNSCGRSQSPGSCVPSRWSGSRRDARQ